MSFEKDAEVSFEKDAEVSFEIVTLEEFLVAGLTVPLSGNRVTRRDLDLINFTWDRYRTRGGARRRVAAYIAQEENSVAVLGYDPVSLDEVDLGDVVTRVPAGRYAKFSVTGQPYDLTRTAWADIIRAERAGQIKRTYVADVERFDDPSAIEVYISVE
ncbi:GyrI-like domain-containing protein [Aldersonia sp. NBC_00410]|uniref:GyrI-like domain-containing protein n=1 Tax=Aldersonia sp. NBC_00410 TaxID=2975954 RepID=UPI00224E881C|nr:GyrI-like domain-containing protein [Aldersonia sp. NBC_00410]MCX5044930.1 GyrI-like domain-containing protein [Aldersonia sp. NBC_00410]